MLVVVLMLAMVLLLLGIGKLHKTEEDDKHSAEELRREIKDSHRIITRHSVFHNFLAKRNKTNRLQ